ANLVIAGVQAGLSHRAAREKALDYLKQFGLEEHAGAYPAQVSGGQRQRVAIIQQIMCSEHFLLMDEPFSGLDVIALGKVARLISKIANLDDLNTIVVVTHSIAAAVEVADTVWLLGYDKDALGNPIPGARIQRTYDLIERGLAWREDITKDPLFFEVVREITADFHQV
ncbi:MAG: ATP-binding cassette domain-containing protein, partial [bacterium]|nr:ATP-binding cassette domain-containing protein [bacterium]